MRQRAGERGEMGYGSEFAADVQTLGILPTSATRPPIDFLGANRSNDVKRRGHIPGENVFWMDNLVSTQNNVLKPPAEIRASYEAAGVKPGSKVVSIAAPVFRPRMIT